MAPRVIIVYGFLLFLSRTYGAFDDMSELLRSRVEQHVNQNLEVMGGEVLRSHYRLPEIYRIRGFEPIWLERGRPRPVLGALLGELAGAADHGLDPEAYHLERLRVLLERLGGNPARHDRVAVAVELDLLATDAFLIYATHLASGAVDPVSLDASWRADRAEVDTGALLEQALREQDLRAVFGDLLPKHPDYVALMRALRTWRAQPERSIAPLPPGPVIRPGQRHDQVPLIRSVLMVSASSDDRYDSTLEVAVRAFQSSHNLEPDGMIGDKTRKALEQSPSDRVDQLRVNLERWRWLPRNLGGRHIIVNIAGYTVRVVEDGETVLAMNAIVGRPVRETPVFSADMTYLVLSPYWHVPTKLATQDKLPILRSNPQKLKDQGYRVFDGWGADAAELDILTIAGKLSGKRGFPYRMRQDPGPQNALGDVKFMFPNPHNVYLHDTPDRALFDKTERSFSSGCIRISQPIELAVHLLRGQSGWDERKIRQVIEAGKETTVMLPQRYRVHLLYWTVAVTGEETRFLPDIYGRDSRLIEALNRISERDK